LRIRLSEIHFQISLTVAAKINVSLNGSVEFEIEGRICPLSEKLSEIQKGKQPHFIAMPANCSPTGASIASEC
jgi:hypothetical protein